MLDLNINIGNVDFSAQKMGMALPAACRRIVTSLKRQIKHYGADNAVTFDRLVDDYFCNKTAPGSIVSTTGVLSRYILSPRSKFDTKFGRVIEETKKIFNPFSNVTEASYTISPIPGQYPVQTIKPVAIDRLVFIYFLYPPDISSFYLTQSNLDVLDSFEKKSLIPRSSKPILVISPKPIGNDLHREIRVTGKLSSIDDAVVTAISSTLTSSALEVLSNTLNPFCEAATSLCIDLRDGANISVIGDVREIPAQLYVEAHFESDRLPIHSVDEFLSETNEILWVDMGFGDGLSWGLRNSKTTIASSDNKKRFCYLTPTILSNRQSYETSVRTLHEDIESFRKRVQKIAQGRNTTIRHKLDFIFDHEKERLFHPEGAFRSTEVEMLMKQEPEMVADIDWLRSRG